MLTKFFYIENKQSYNYLKNMRSFCTILYKADFPDTILYTPILLLSALVFQATLPGNVPWFINSLWTTADTRIYHEQNHSNTTMLFCKFQARTLTTCNVELGVI